MTDPSVLVTPSKKLQHQHGQRYNTPLDHKRERDLVHRSELSQEVTLLPENLLTKPVIYEI